MRIGTIEFETRAEYNAGLRDYNRIQRLKLQNDLDDVTVAAKLYKELKQQTFFFETEVGKKFVRELAEDIGPSGRGLGVGIVRRGFKEPEEEVQEIPASSKKQKKNSVKQRTAKQQSDESHESVRQHSDNKKIIRQGSDIDRPRRNEREILDDTGSRTDAGSRAAARAERIVKKRPERLPEKKIKESPTSKINVISYFDKTPVNDNGKDRVTAGTESSEPFMAGQTGIQSTAGKPKSASQQRADVRKDEKLDNRVLTTINDAKDQDRSLTEQEEEKKKSRRPVGAVMRIAAVVASLVLLFSLGNEALYQYRIYQSGVKIQELQNSILSPITTVSEESSVILDKIALASEESAIIQTQASGNTEAVTLGNDTATPEILYEYSTLYERNSDLIGWIEIPGTIVNYPVMQTKEDQNFYLRRDFDKEDDVSGLPFLDARSDILDRTTNLLIYGHNMKNGTMFATLLEYKDQSFYEEHKTIVFNTIYEKAEYEIIASFRSSIAYVDEDVFRYYNFIDAATPEEFNSFIENINALTEYDTGITAEYGDELITLSTCDKSIDDGRYVIVAKKINDQ